MTDVAKRDRAVEVLFITQYDLLRRLAFVLLGDAGAAEDVVMDAFARAMSSWVRFRNVEEPTIYMRRMDGSGIVLTPGWLSFRSRRFHDRMERTTRRFGCE